MKLLEGLEEAAVLVPVQLNFYIAASAEEFH